MREREREGEAECECVRVSASECAAHRPPLNAHLCVRSPLAADRAPLTCDDRFVCLGAGGTPTTLQHSNYTVTTGSCASAPAGL